DARVLRLPLRAARYALDRIPGVGPRIKDWLRLHAVVRHLRGQAFLGFQTGPSVLGLLGRCEPVVARARGAHRADGRRPDRWFALEEGAPRPPAAAGHVRSPGPGDSFGERALAGLPGLPLAEATSDVRCIALRRSDFAPPGAADLSLQSIGS